MGMSPYLKSIRRKIGNELLLTPGVAAIIRNASNQILLQRRGDNGLWSLPGGGVDPGETPAEAIVREVLEETGLRVEPTAIVGVLGGLQHMRFTYPNGDQIEVVATLFACRVLGGRLRAEGEETLALDYFDLASLPPLFPPYPHALLAHTGPGAWFAKPAGVTDGAAVAEVSSEAR